MGTIKGKQSIRSAVTKLYPSLPFTFSLMRLHTEVIREVQRPYLYLDTSRRKLMELREEGLVKFKCISKRKSLYQKELS
jgi:hypothetical protein